MKVVRALLRRLFLIMGLCALLTACENGVTDPLETGEYPAMFPDYKQVCIPPNIAPLNFAVVGADDVCVEFEADGNVLFRYSGINRVNIPADDWKQLLQQSRGKEFSVQVYGFTKDDKKWRQYKPFQISVSSDSIDAYIAYRLIEPGYEHWSKMGIYQRELSTFREKPIFETTLSGTGGCVNCHAFADYSPEKFLFHSRKASGGTVIFDHGKERRIDLKTDSTISPAVYPKWHKSGDYIAFSTNSTRLTFHAFDPNRAVVYDLQSDLMIYDYKNNRLLLDDRFMSDSIFETFPTWSSDGKWLYFCRADARSLPFDYKELKYGIYKVPFDENTGALGDSIVCVVDEKMTGKTALFPRISPDGRFLLYTTAGYGAFTIWIGDADLAMINLQTGEPVDVSAVNSLETESYHSWSSDGRWVLFSSKRIDGLYTRLYMAHCDPDGKMSKPFLLPQQDPRYYTRLLQAYNVPEFISDAVKLTPYEIERVVKGDKTLLTE